MQGDVVCLCLVPFRKFCYFSNIIFYRIWGKRNKSEVLHVIFVFISQSKSKEIGKNGPKRYVQFLLSMNKVLLKVPGNDVYLVPVLFHNEFAKLRALRTFVPYVPSRLTILCAFVPSSLACLRALRALIFTRLARLTCYQRALLAI